MTPQARGARERWETERRAALEEIELVYEQACRRPSDIHEHLPTLRRYAERARKGGVIELGVRGITSTWAFLAARPKWLLSVDMCHPKQHGGDLPRVERLAKAGGLDFRFWQADDRKIRLPTADLLFIDTLHTYDQLKIELELHAAAARRWIILHDTETFGEVGELRKRLGLRPALEEFLTDESTGRIWKVKEVHRNNNGLTVLECPWGDSGAWW